MSTTIIKNPAINSPNFEPKKHFQFFNEGITNKIISGRRIWSFFILITQPKQNTKQLTITERECVGDRIEENTFINQIRDRVKIWRDNTWPGTTEVTRKLGVQAFGTQLLCEQVEGRALQKQNSVVDEEGIFSPECAEVCGV